MAYLQKNAVFTLLILLAIAGIFGITLQATGDPIKNCAGFALFALVALMSRRLLRRGQDLVMDERDKQILKRSTLLAYTVFLICFCACGAGLPLLAGADALIPTSYLAVVPWLGLWIVSVLRSGSILILNARGA